MLARFVARASGREVETWASYNALGFFDTRGLKVAVVYNHFVWPDIAMHVASRQGALWCHPGLLYHIFAYPFLQLQCRRVTATVWARNEPCIRAVQALGYTREGTLRDADSRGGDIILFGMLMRECRWLDYKEAHEEPLPVLAPATARMH